MFSTKLQYAGKLHSIIDRTITVLLLHKKSLFNVVAMLPQVSQWSPFSMTCIPRRNPGETKQENSSKRDKNKFLCLACGVPHLTQIQNKHLSLLAETTFQFTLFHVQRAKEHEILHIYKRKFLSYSAALNEFCKHSAVMIKIKNFSCTGYHF